MEGKLPGTRSVQNTKLKKVEQKNSRQTVRGRGRNRVIKGNNNKSSFLKGGDRHSMFMLVGANL